MVLDRIPADFCSLSAVDGRKLAARWWPGADAHQRSLVILSALGAPQAYLSWFAQFLAKQGWGVLTFDYRGIGQSRHVQSDTSVTADDWINFDLPTAIAAVKDRVNPVFLGVIAHSVGGQLLGQSPIRTEINGALFLSAQRGIPALFQGRSRLRIHYAYTLFPLLISLLGELPVSRWTLPQPCPPQALLQWMRWGRTGVFTDIQGNDMEAKFADFHGPLTTITVDDDHDYASNASVVALASLYSGAHLTEKTIYPQDYNLDSLGHFGIFHRRAPRTLWIQIEAELRHIYEAGLLTTNHKLSVKSTNIGIGSM